VEIDPGPVPAARRWVEDRGRPFMVEPGDAPRGRTVDSAAHPQLRTTVVVAGLSGLRPLAREALLALQPRRIARITRWTGRRQLQVQGEGRVADDGAVAVVAAARERPVADRDVGVPLRERGAGRADPGGAL